MLLSDRYERQQVTVHWVYPHRQTFVFLLRQCSRRGCHHRDHSHLAMCFHRDCYNLLLRHKVAPTAKPCYPTMQDIWKLGRSTLWLSLPDFKSSEKRKTSLVSASCPDVFLEAFELNSSNSVSELYHLLSRLPPELRRPPIPGNTHSFRPLSFSIKAGYFCKALKTATLNRSA